MGPVCKLGSENLSCDNCSLLHGHFYSQRTVRKQFVSDLSTLLNFFIDVKIHSRVPIFVLGKYSSVCCRVFNDVKLIVDCSTKKREVNLI